MNLNQFEIVVNVVSAATILVLFLSHRKGVADAIKKALDGAQVATKTLEPMVAATPLAPYVNVLDAIEQAAQKGVQLAQQLHNEDATVNRPQVAVDYAHTALQELGIELSDRVQKLVDGAIKAAVYVLKQNATTTAQDAPPEEAEPAPAPQPVIPDHVQKLMQAANEFATAAGQSDAAATAAVTTFPPTTSTPTTADKKVALQEAQ
jgi:hypothetical protein